MVKHKKHKERMPENDKNNVTYYKKKKKDDEESEQGKNQHSGHHLQLNK